MRKHLIQFLLVAVLLVFTSAAWAQTQCMVSLSTLKPANLW